MEVNSNYYIKDSVNYDRVTRVLDIINDDSLNKFIQARGSRYVEQVFNEAGERGTKSHSLFAAYANGAGKCLITAIEFTNPEQADILKLFANWFDKNVSKVIAIEKTVYDGKLKVAGTYDLIAEIKGKIVLVDYKTGSIVNKKSRLQTAAYAKMSGMKIDKRLILHINGGKIQEMLIKTSLAEDYGLFLCAYNLFKQFT